MKNRCLCSGFFMPRWQRGQMRPWGKAQRLRPQEAFRSARVLPVVLNHAVRTRTERSFIEKSRSAAMPLSSARLHHA